MDSITLDYAIAIAIIRTRLKRAHEQNAPRAKHLTTAGKDRPTLTPMGKTGANPDNRRSLMPTPLPALLPPLLAPPSAPLFVRDSFAAMDQAAGLGGGGTPSPCFPTVETLLRTVNYINAELGASYRPSDHLTFMRRVLQAVKHLSSTQNFSALVPHLQVMVVSIFCQRPDLDPPTIRKLRYVVTIQVLIMRQMRVAEPALWARTLGELVDFTEALLHQADSPQGTEERRFHTHFSLRQRLVTKLAHRLGFFVIYYQLKLIGALLQGHSATESLAERRVNLLSALLVYGEDELLEVYQSIQWPSPKTSVDMS